MANHLRVLLAAVLCTALGFVCFHLQSDGQPLMNAWGILSFTALGASLGCLACPDDSSGPFDFWGGW